MELLFIGLAAWEACCTKREKDADDVPIDDDSPADIPRACSKVEASQKPHLRACHAENEVGVTGAAVVEEDEITVLAACSASESQQRRAFAAGCDDTCIASAGISLGASSGSSGTDSVALMQMAGAALESMANGADAQLQVRAADSPRRSEKRGGATVETQDIGHNAEQTPGRSGHRHASHSPTSAAREWGVAQAHGRKSRPALIGPSANRRQLRPCKGSRELNCKRRGRDSWHQDSPKKDRELPQMEIYAPGLGYYVGLDAPCCPSAWIS
mmetsp:Transcript_121133/g.304603  ORF Transcript_121133/g.304603 Transcript_121133/m.304603 type:complete len:271 (-) Transcript_121133:57-869(-)